ncbi:AAA family ATPase [Anaerovibrio sp. RM50]|uniref:AAA family ATPase n=1 Tax=Anaerovibrio sp. RM50 TaxID=1200557 RepID=UPI0004801C09|nr:AAA family ATPase [Anaerovibrio sp. RM50]
MQINMKDNIVAILRGVPGSGKSTWIKEHGVEDYSISLDKLRLMLSNPIKSPNGYFEINQAVSETAWKLAYEFLKSRMRNGGVTFVDATFMNEYLINFMNDLVCEYKYKLLVIDFSSVGLEEAKRRNHLRRDTIRYVPESVLDKLWQEGATTNFGDITKVDYYDVEIIPF